LFTPDLLLILTFGFSGKSELLVWNTPSIRCVCWYVHILQWTYWYYSCQQPCRLDGSWR